MECEQPRVRQVLEELRKKGIVSSLHFSPLAIVDRKDPVVAQRALAVKNLLYALVAQDYGCPFESDDPLTAEERSQLHKRMGGYPRFLAFRMKKESIDQMRREIALLSLHALRN